MLINFLIVIEYREHQGPFIKSCPCSPSTVSCGYHNLNLHTGCPYDCSYCILQVYLDHKSPVFSINLGDLKNELKEFSARNEQVRIGTGELSDSLAYDHRTGYSLKIISLFEMFSQVVFEFKTKSNQIGNLLRVKNVLSNLVVSWSLNPGQIARREETRAPSLKNRLRAMNQVQKRGYKIGIHLDPIIFVDDWQALYTGLISQIVSVVDPARIVWISLGALRFPYSLREHIFKNKKSRLFEGELVKGYDNKYRYFKPLRLEMFKYISEKIRTLISAHIPLYLCMEDKEAWEEVFPRIKPDTNEINKQLYLSVFEIK